MTLPTDQRWEKLFDALGARSFFDFISGYAIQDQIFAIKLIFIFFGIFFLCAVVYFYINSSYLKYQVLQDVTEFFSWQAYGLQEVNRRWKVIMKKAQAGSEKELKIAILEADDFLKQELLDADYQGDTVEELAQNAGRKMLPNLDEILQAHMMRNSIVRDVNYKLDSDLAKKALDNYEKAIKNIYSY